MTRLLLGHGAEVNQANSKSDHELPLQIAVARKDREIISLLVPHASRWSLDQGIKVTASRGDWDMCQLLLIHGADLNLALHNAAGERIKEVVKQLIHEGTDLKVKELGCEIDNSLIAAADTGHEAVVGWLLEGGADGSMAGYSCTNALQAAAGRGHDSIVRLLLTKNVDVNADGGRGTALYRAARFGHLGSVKLLLDNGAKAGSSKALCYAARSGHAAVVQELLDRGSDINSYGDRQYPSAIQVAAQAGDLPLVQYLVHRGASVNTTNGRRSALQESAELDNAELVQLLLDKGSDVECRDGGEPSAPHCATRTGRIENVKILLARGADVNRHNRIVGGTESALHAAAREGEVDIARVLLEAGADVNDRVADRVGFTALHLAVCAGHDSVLPVLIDDFRADFGSKLTDGSLALHSAVLRGFRTCVEFLLGKGMDVNSKNYGGLTALHFAVVAGQKDMVAFLLEKKIDVEVVGGKTDSTALDLVEINMRSNILHSVGDRGMWEELAEMLRMS